MPRPDGPLIIQSDYTILVEVAHPEYEAARDKLSMFAELVKCPDYIHTYRVTRISIWNAASLGIPLEEITGYLESASRYPVPEAIKVDITSWYSRYGKLKMTKKGGRLYLESSDPRLLFQLTRIKDAGKWLKGEVEGKRVEVAEAGRGILKQVLARAGYPVEDIGGYEEGAYLGIHLLERTKKGLEFRLRRYQEEAARIFHAGGTARGGSGVVCLPCGAGKTIVGMAVMSLVRNHTLILTTNTVAARQWKEELLDKTNLEEKDIGEYTGERKEIRPVTITTYQMVTYRKGRGLAFSHMEIFNKGKWGLVIYDEVHLLPAQVFRVTASIQGTRRLGLTATLVREDGREEDVFSLIGPKKYDLPWKILEKQGWIAKATCREIRVSMTEELEAAYRNAETEKERYRIAAENPLKDTIVERILTRHGDDRILIIGQYLKQLQRISRKFSLSIITGSTPVKERERVYDEFRKGNIPVLVVSKVGNFAVDLPDANIAVQVSGTFGSRQEEAQRLGRILRPKKGRKKAVFYSLVSEGTSEEKYSRKRQLFLAEQGYEYEIIKGSEMGLDLK